MFKYKIILLIALVAAALVSGCSTADKTVAPSNLVMTGGVLPLAIAEHSYTHTVVATGGQLNYEFELDHDMLPPGIVAEWVDNDLVFHGNATQLGTFTIPVTIVQTGAVLSVSGFLGNSSITLPGTIGGENGNVVTVAGSFPEEGGTTTVVHTWTLTSSTAMSGIESWSWTDGTDNCPGSSATVVCTKTGP